MPNRQLFRLFVHVVATPGGYDDDVILGPGCG